MGGKVAFISEALAIQPSVTNCSAVSAVPVNIADNLKKVEASWSINPAVVEIQDPPNEQLGSTR